jgi:hypothetical protein
MIPNRYPMLLHYKGILCEWIFRKFVIEMKDYGLSATFDYEVLYKINEFLMNWMLKYIDFFKKTNCHDSFMATHNLIINESILKDYVLERILYYTKLTDLPIFCQIGNDFYITKDKEYFPREFFFQFRLSFPLFVFKQISQNEDLDFSNNIDCALFIVSISTIFELLIYLLFNDVGENFNEIKTSHVTDTINALNYFLLTKSDDLKKDDEL